MQIDNIYIPAEFDDQNPAPIPSKKYYTPKMMQVGTFLGGPISAGYFISENYKAFGQREKVGRTWLYALLFTAALFGVIMFVPIDEKAYSGPLKYLIPLLYSWATFSLVKYLQAGSINDHVNAGGTNFGWGRTILISLAWCAVTALAFFILAILMAMINGEA